MSKITLLMENRQLVMVTTSLKLEVEVQSEVERRGNARVTRPSPDNGERTMKRTLVESSLTSAGGAAEGSQGQALSAPPQDH